MVFLMVWLLILTNDFEPMICCWVGWLYGIHDDIRIRSDEKSLKKMLDNIFEILYNQNCIK